MLENIILKAENANIQIPFYVDGDLIRQTDITIDYTKVREIKDIRINKISPAGCNVGNVYVEEYLTDNKLMSSLMFTEINGGTLDLSKLNLLGASITLHKCTLKRLILGSGLVTLKKFLSSSVINDIDFRNVDFSMIKDIRYGFCDTTLKQGVDLRQLRENTLSMGVFENATIFGTVKLGKLRNYYNMFENAKIYCIEMLNLNLTDLKEESTTNFVNGAEIGALDLRGSCLYRKGSCALSLNRATIDTLYVSDVEYILGCGEATLSAKITRIVFDNIKVLGEETSQYSGFTGMENISEIQFINCDDKAVRSVISYLSKYVAVFGYGNMKFKLKERINILKQ